MEAPVYIHIPFCVKKCLYCDFVSYKHNDDMVDRYVNALINEIKLRSGHKAKTVYIGGGTPTCIDRKYLKGILGTLHRNLDMAACSEITIEANPGTLDREKLETLVEMGVNRLSIGFQSWNEKELKRLGRIHGRDEFVANYVLAREAGFKNISVDLMFGIPGQEMEDWKETIMEVSALEPEHISCYSLRIEENTPFHRMAELGEIAEIDEAVDREMYHYAADYLSDRGYHRYEISNFARKGRECHHNLFYWENRPFLGIGAAAHSYENGKRFWNTPDLDEYCIMLERSIIPVKGSETIDLGTEIFETIFLGLRTSKGILFDDFYGRFGFDIREKHGSRIEKLREMGLVDVTISGFHLTPMGIDLSNTVFIEFITD
ncbi:MAG: Heme chaperone HemW [Firmicutes bacterium]|nr:Heme chaperone HemW [Bacillota bacterium]